MNKGQHSTKSVVSTVVSTVKAVRDDTLVAFGGQALKTANADGVPAANGYLVRFSTEDDPDATEMKDFFTKETYFGESLNLPVYFHHGLPIYAQDANGVKTMVGPGKKKIGALSIKADDTGLFVDAVCAEAGEYQTVIQKMLDDGVLGWSSGAASHLVTREPVLDANGEVKAHRITQWPLAEGSLTHTPGEPRNGASAPQITSIKSLLGQYGTYSWYYEDGDSDDWDASREMSTAAADVLLYRLSRAVRNILSDEKMTPAEQVEAIAGVYEEARTLTQTIVSALAGLDSTDDAATEIAVKSAFKAFVPEGEIGVAESRKAVSLTEQGEQLKADTDAYFGRASRLAALKSGAISPETKSVGQHLVEAAKPVVGVPYRTAAAPQGETRPTTPEMKSGEPPAPLLEMDAADREHIERRIAQLKL